MLGVDERLSGVSQLLNPGLVGLDLLLEVLVLLHLAVQVGRVLQAGRDEVSEAQRLYHLKQWFIQAW